MIFLPGDRYLSLDVGAKTVRAQCSLRRKPTRTSLAMARYLLAIVAIACVHQAAARPVKKTLNFNMFLLPQRQSQSDRFILTTDGVSRFGPLLEYLVQRFQGLMSVRNRPDQLAGYTNPQSENPQSPIIPIADASENEVDSAPLSRTPGVVVRPSSTKPGTFEVEINVVVDDGQPDDKKN